MVVDTEPSQVRRGHMGLSEGGQSHWRGVTVNPDRCKPPKCLNSPQVDTSPVLSSVLELERCVRLPNGSGYGCRGKTGREEGGLSSIPSLIQSESTLKTKTQMWPKDA